MDTLDVRMLKLLQDNGRMTVSQLSQLLSLSRPSVAERLNRLQEQGDAGYVSQLRLQAANNADCVGVPRRLGFQVDQ